MPRTSPQKSAPAFVVVVVLVCIATLSVLLVAGLSSGLPVVNASKLHVLKANSAAHNCAEGLRVLLNQNRTPAYMSACQVTDLSLRDDTKIFRINVENEGAHIRLRAVFEKQDERFSLRWLYDERG